MHKQHLEITSITKNGLLTNNRLRAVQELLQITKSILSSLGINYDNKTKEAFSSLTDDLLSKSEFMQIDAAISRSLIKNDTYKQQALPDFFEDPKDQYYQTLINYLKKESSSQKQLGAFYTPSDVVETLVTTVIEKSRIKVSELKSKKALDPTMGGGDWLIAWFNYLLKLDVTIKNNNDKRLLLFTTCIFGVDIDPVAVLTTRLIFWNALGYKYNVCKHLKNNLVLGNTLNLFSNKNTNTPNFDFIIGNPPYVVQNLKSINCITKNTNNVYAAITEAATELLKPSGMIAFVIPLSVNCSKSTKDLREYLHSNYSQIEYSTYGIRPQKMFHGVDQRITVLIAKKKKNLTDEARYSSYNGHFLWKKRADLTEALKHTGLGCDITNLDLVNDGWPKIQKQLEVAILHKTRKSNNSTTFFDLLTREQTQFPIYYFGNARYFIKALDYIPHYKNKINPKKENSELKVVYAKNKDAQSAIIALMNSTFFIWAWTLFSDCFHVDVKLLKHFDASNVNFLKLSPLAKNVVTSLKKYSQKKLHSDNIITEFDVKKSLSDIKAIDLFFAKHFNLNKDEQSFLFSFMSDSRNEKISTKTTEDLAA